MTPRAGQALTKARRPSRPERIAYHEAGHAVVARIFGQDVVRVTLGGPGKLGGGVELVYSRHVRRSLRADLAPWWRIVQTAMASLAGAAAEAVLTGRPAWAGASHDLASVYSVASRVCFSEDEISTFIEWLYVRTRTLLALPGAWRSVIRVARALLRRHELSGPDLNALIDIGAPR